MMKLLMLVPLLVAVMPLLASAQRGRGRGRRPTLNKSTDMLVPVIEGEIGENYRNMTSAGSELHYVYKIENMGMAL